MRSVVRVEDRIEPTRKTRYMTGRLSEHDRAAAILWPQFNCERSFRRHPLALYMCGTAFGSDKDRHRQMNRVKLEMHLAFGVGAVPLPCVVRKQCEHVSTGKRCTVTAHGDGAR